MTSPSIRLIPYKNQGKVMGKTKTKKSKAQSNGKAKAKKKKLKTKDIVRRDDFQVLLPESADPEAISPKQLAQYKLDVVSLSKTATKFHIRGLVQLFYDLQKLRIRFGNRTDAEERVTHREPHALPAKQAHLFHLLEEMTKKQMLVFAEEWRVGRWLNSMYGVGPVISAGLLSYLDSPPPPTVGNWWRFAGLDPTSVWEAKTQRPHNAKLKSFILTRCMEVMLRNGKKAVSIGKPEKDFWGPLYERRKSYEWQKNLSGDYPSRAARSIHPNLGHTTVSFKCYTGCFDPQVFNEAYFNMSMKERLAYLVESEKPPHYPEEVFTKEFFLKSKEERVSILEAISKPAGSGQVMIPPAQIKRSVVRVLAKIFLEHVHRGFWNDYYGSDTSFDFVHEGQIHTHRIDPAVWPMPPGGKSLRDLDTIIPQEKAKTAEIDGV
jgi:hypothetical protein